MWKASLLFALAANLVASGYRSTAYFDRLGTVMNEAINSRYRCVNRTVDEYSDECSEIFTGYDYEDLAKPFREATTVINGFCVYQLAMINQSESQLTSAEALMFLIGKLSQNAIGKTRVQMYNIINLDNQNQIRYLYPKITRNSAATTGDFISTITTIMFSNKEFTKNYQKCTRELINGETRVVDYSDPSAAAETINAWFAAQTRFDGVDVVAADDICGKTGLISGSSHNVEFEFDGFNFNKQVDIDFYHSKNNVTTLAVWKGEGRAKYYFDEKLQSKVVLLPLKGDHHLLVIQPKVGQITELLFYLRDDRNFVRVISQVKDTYLNLLLPMIDYAVKNEDFVIGLQLANQFTPIYFSNFNGFWNILKNTSGYVSHMYHQIHLSIRGLGQNATSRNSKWSSTKDVEINSGFAFYVIDSSWTPILSGTNMGESQN